VLHLTFSSPAATAPGPEVTSAAVACRPRPALSGSSRKTVFSLGLDAVPFLVLKSYLFPALARRLIRGGGLPCLVN
jgi:hypothetical protein